MQILKLVISKNGEELREIPFKKGLNLVINKSVKSANTGNGVGKTTLSKIIDCLFLGKIEQIYKRPLAKVVIASSSDLPVQRLS